MVTGHATVHNCRISLLCDRFCSLIMIYPIRESPHAGVNLSKLNRTTGVVLNSVLELLVEDAVIEEDVGIVVPAIEVTFD